MASITVSSTTDSWVNNTTVGSQDWWTGSSGDLDASDDSYVQFVWNGSSTVTTHYLEVTLASLSAIPSGATIDGIELSIERSESRTSANAVDNSVRLRKTSGYVGDDKAAAGEWPLSDAVKTYGSSSDLWGTTWTRDEVVNQLKVGLSTTITDSEGGPAYAYVDHVQVTVYYTELVQITAPLLSADILAVTSIDLTKDLTAPLLSATGTYTPASLDLTFSLNGILLSATGTYTPASIDQGFKVTAPLLSATGMYIPSIPWDQNITAPALAATGQIVAAVQADQQLAGALLQATGLLDTGVWLIDQNVTGQLLSATGILDTGTWAIDSQIAGVYISATGLVVPVLLGDLTATGVFTFETPGSDGFTFETPGSDGFTEE